MSLPSATTFWLEPSNGDREDHKDELTPQEWFGIAIERLEGNVPRENQEFHQPLQPLFASLITMHAGSIYQHLAYYHLWRINKNERGGLISDFAQYTGVSKATIQLHMRNKEQLVSDILTGLHSGERTPWAIVIVLVMLIQPMIKPKSQCVTLVNKLLQKYENQDWQNPSFATDSVIDVIQIVSGLNIKSKIRDRQSRVIPPPREGGLYKLNLPDSLLQGPGPNSE